MAPPGTLADQSAPGETRLPGLDGLRGLAVVAILLFHLDEELLPGGFLGVDMFFVLSGYLITSLLLDERARTGGTALGAFWARRVRRLLPAVLVVLITLALLLPSLGPEARGLWVPQMLAALAYVTNWQLLVTEVPYFSDFADPSPVRHLWSLAIEEQFYLVWPLLFTVLATSRRRLILSITVGLVASVLAMAALYDPATTSRAYFGTDARAHQILLGCLAAVLLAAHPRMGDRTRSVVGAGSLVGLALAIATLTGATPFYYQGGSLLVAGLTVGVIVGCERPDTAPARLLALWPLRGLGEISYGLYLWHWPVIVLLGADRLGLQGVPLALAQTAISLALAGLSYQLVERPVRRGALGRWTAPSWRLAVAVPTLVAVVAGVIVVAGAGRSTEPVYARGADPGEIVGDRPNATRSADPGEIAGDRREPVRARSIWVRPVTAVGVVGDSVAWSLSGGIQEEVLRRDLQMVHGAVMGCHLGEDPILDPEGNEASGAQKCLASVDETLTAVRAARPDVLLWLDYNAGFPRRTAAGDLVAEGPEWQRAVLEDWDRALEHLRTDNLTVVVIRPPLRSLDPVGECAGDHAARCATVQLNDERLREVSDAFVTRHAGGHDVVGIDIDDLVCPSLPCPEMVAGIRLRAAEPDLTHFVEGGSVWIGPFVFDRALAAAEEVRRAKAEADATSGR